MTLQALLHLHYFYPRSPCGERRGWTLNINGPMKFLSTLSLRRATNRRVNLFRFQTIISIHALLAESDRMYQLSPKAENDFYPRSPCGERLNELLEQSASYHISIHALLAESDINSRTNHIKRNEISIHALLAESDQIKQTCRVETSISIHALLAESDSSAGRESDTEENFYPRSPCGERLNSGFLFCLLFKFLSTLSLRRATMHALKFANPMLFLSTLSLRRATKIRFLFRLPKKFLSTLSLRRATGRLPINNSIALQFLSTLSLRRATINCKAAETAKTSFLSTLSLRRATILFRR